MNVGEAAEIHPNEEEKSQITPSAPGRRKTRQPQVDFLTKEEEITEAINSEKVVEYCQARGLLPQSSRLRTLALLDNLESPFVVFGEDRLRSFFLLPSSSVLSQ
nr:unnamed protein product [Spirometra erinaceieuropaei]